MRSKRQPPLAERTRRRPCRHPPRSTDRLPGPPTSSSRGGTPCRHPVRKPGRGAVATLHAERMERQSPPTQHGARIGRPRGTCPRPARWSQVWHGRHSRRSKIGDRGIHLDLEAGDPGPEAQVIRMAGGMDFRRPFPRAGAGHNVARGRHRGHRHVVAPAGGGAPCMHFAGTAPVDSRARRTKWG